MDRGLRRFEGGSLNVEAAKKTVSEQIVEFLVLAPKRTLSEICEKLERKPGEIRNTLRAMDRDGLAHCETDRGGRNPLWCAGPKPVPTIEVVERPAVRLANTRPKTTNEHLINHGRFLLERAGADVAGLSDRTFIDH